MKREHNEFYSEHYTPEQYNAAYEDELLAETAERPEERFIHADEYNRDFAGGLGERQGYEGEEGEQDALQNLLHRSAPAAAGMLASRIAPAAMGLAAVITVGAAVVLGPVGSALGLNYTAQDDGGLIISFLHSHEGGEWVSTKQCSCTEEGLAEQYCTECGEFMAQQNEAPLGHDESDWIIDLQWTCTEAGDRHTECLRCGETMRTEHIDAMHTVVTLEAVEATCEHDGLTEGSCCEVCGEVLQQQEIIPAAHRPVTDAAVAATCYSTGLTEGSHCSLCGKVLKEQRVTPKQHGPLITLRGYPAVCDANNRGTEGLSDGSQCSICNEIVVPQTVIQPTHNLVQEPSLAPTCEDMGYIGEVHCSICGWVESYPQQLAPTGHQWQLTGVDPTGLDIYTCTVCGSTTNYP